MQKIGLIICLAAFAAVAAQAQTTQPNSSVPKPVQSFDLNAIDKSVEPCVDFYHFACGNWLKQNPIPADQAAWGRFNELHERNQIILRNILEKQSADNSNRSSNDQKTGDYYFSCMDETAIESKGTQALQPVLDRINAVKDKAELPQLMGGLHNQGINALFAFSSEPDAKNASMVIAGTDQGGLGLPDRDYYLKDDAKSVELRNKYQQHVTNMFKLLGDSPDQAASEAKTVMQFETVLAKVSMDRVERRDPNKVYHKMTTAQLQELSPAFKWSEYLVTIKAPEFSSLDVSEPDFVKGMNQLIATDDLDSIKTYLRWQAVHAAATMLPKAFVDENFAFFGKTLTGAQELRPRWKRCVQYTNSDLGEALGQAFVAEAFPPESKAATLKMVHELEDALKKDISELSWMGADTKKQALDKLSHIDNKIGYPNKWRDYGSLEVVRGDALGNSFRANNFEFHRELNKINKPVDRQEWEMTPPTVNAYYNPLENNINFPAGILQPPFYDKNADDSTNFGGIGAVIGHELTHGFDDQGSQFDAQGNLREWWTPQDRERFTKLEDCFVNEYDDFVVIDDVHIKGRLTLGENTADNGGIRISHMALLDVLASSPEKDKDGFTPEQRFYLGWGQIWCENVTPEATRLQALTNEHSDPKYRVNGVVSNDEGFAKAFGCKPGSPMIRKNACRVW
jgi:endothelin-converting enzyme/putative endopeptidase